MLVGLHAVVHAEDPAAARAFFADVLGLPALEAHDGWLIFGTGPAEVGVHPAEPGGIHHEISFVCDDIEATVAELGARGAVFRGDVVDRVFGRCARLVVPGAGELLVYEPRHPTAFER